MYGEDRFDNKMNLNQKVIEPHLSNERKNKVMPSRNVFKPRLSKKNLSKRHLNDNRNNNTLDKKIDSRSIISSSQTIPLKSVRRDESKNNKVDFEKKLCSNLNKITNSKNLKKNKDEKKKSKIKDFEGQSEKISSKIINQKIIPILNFKITFPDLNSLLKISGPLALKSTKSIEK